MWGHLSEERLLDVLEGNADAAACAHAEACPRCGERLESARGGLSLAREAGAIPEPSPLYWDAFGRQLDRLVLGGAGAWNWGWRPAFATAAALAVLIALVPGSPSREPAAPRTLPAWSALPPVAEDASFALLLGLEAGEDEVAAESLRHGVAGVVGELSDAEQKRFAEALQALLQAERGGKKS